MQNVCRLHKRLCVFFNDRLFIECITVKQNKINHNADNFVYVCINVTKMNTQEEPIISIKPRKRRWWMWLIASPFLLFLLLVFLLYLPPVQWFAVQKASEFASGQFRDDDADYVQTPDGNWYRFDIRLDGKDVEVDVTEDGKVSQSTYGFW